MTVKDAYKIGFLSKMADAGLSPSALEARFAKRASGDKKESPADKALPFLTKLLIGAVPAAGAIGGWSLAGTDNMSEADLDAIRQKMVIDEYATARDELRRRQRREAMRHEGLVMP